MTFFFYIGEINDRNTFDIPSRGPLNVVCRFSLRWLIFKISVEQVPLARSCRFTQSPALRRLIHMTKKKKISCVQGRLVAVPAARAYFKDFFTAGQSVSEGTCFDQKGHFAHAERQCKWANFPELRKESERDHPVGYWE